MPPTVLIFNPGIFSLDSVEHLGQVILYCEETILCIVESLEASLAHTHEMLASFSSPM